MKKLHLMAFAAMLALTACSDASQMDTSEVLVEESAMAQNSGDNIDPVTGMPLEGYGTENMYGQAANGVPAGTQQDLVTNIGDRVFYGYDRSDITPEGRETLERQARWLQQYPSINVVIEGHADERGTREYNLALGDRRAVSARNYLVALGINPTRIRTISYGKERPAVAGSNATSWAQNRRAVTVVE